VIVNNGAIMRVLIKNDVMVSGRWLKPGEVVVIPNNKAAKELEADGIAEVVKWRTRKVPDMLKPGPTENAALKPELEIAEAIEPPAKVKKALEPAKKRR